MDCKITPYPKTLYDADNDMEMAIEEKKKSKILDEDEDQGEMDMIFWGGLLIYSIVNRLYLSSRIDSHRFICFFCFDWI